MNNPKPKLNVAGSQPLKPSQLGDFKANLAAQQQKDLAKPSKLDEKKCFGCHKVKPVGYS